MRKVWTEQENPDSAITAKPGRDATGGKAHGLWWTEASVWTDRMVSGWQRRPRGQEMPSSRIKGSSPFRQLLKTRDTPDEETGDWRAVCGKTARTVRRAGRVNTLPDPYRGEASVPIQVIRLYPLRSLPPLHRFPLDKEHPLQPAFAKRLAEDAESEKRNEHQQHDDEAGDCFLQPRPNELAERGSN
jgi:hypothetical protein